MKHCLSRRRLAIVGCLFALLGCHADRREYNERASDESERMVASDQERDWSTAAVDVSVAVEVAAKAATMRALVWPKSTAEDDAQIATNERTSRIRVVLPSGWTWGKSLDCLIGVSWDRVSHAVKSGVTIFHTREIELSK